MSKKVNGVATEGVVRWFDKSKGYGFIAPDNGGEDVYVHHSGIEGVGRYKNLEEGQRVEFCTGEGRKGVKAVEVRVVG